MKNRSVRFGGFLAGFLTTARALAPAAEIGRGEGGGRRRIQDRLAA